MIKSTVTLSTLTLGLLAALNIAACGGTADEHAHDHDHAAHSHVDHEGHAQADHAATAEEATAGEAAMEMEGMAKVDPEGAVKSWGGKPDIGAKGICPVSGEAFLVTDKTVFSVVDGKYYGYCCPGCQGRFEADPQSFIARPAEG